MMIDDVIGKLVADKYRVESLIAERESGDLFHGRNEMLDRPVSIKVLSPALAIDNRWVKSFINEARSASAVTHPNILNITDFGTDAKGLSYAVYEPVEGQPLADMLGAGLPMEEHRCLSLVSRAAEAVAAAHEKNVLHGKLDPRAVYVTTDGNGGDKVKVVDFGSDPLNVPRDADPRYLAPEQCTQYPTADERTDVYSLGVMLYETLSGVVPYDGPTPADVLIKQNGEPPAPLSAFRRDLHPDIEPIVLTAIAIDPDRRYQTVKALFEDLELLTSSIGDKGSAKAASAGTGRNVWQTAFVALAGISLLAVALIYATSVRQTDPIASLQQPDLGGLPVQPIGPATGAQEESLASMPVLTDAEIMSSAAAMQQQLQSDLPGGDGYNAWANGGVPPAGAPPVGYVPPGGQVYTIDPSTGSQFMPNLSGVELRCMDPATRQEIPCPNAAAPAEKPQEKQTVPKTPANANTAAEPVASPKPLATPPPKAEKTPAKPAANKPGPAAQEPKTRSDDSGAGVT